VTPTRSKRKCRPKDRPRKQAEGSLQDAIREYIAYRGYRCEPRKVHGAARTLVGGNFIAGCEKRGRSDLDVYVPTGTPWQHYIVHFEVKRKGAYQEQEQKVWQKLVEGHQEFYFVVRSIEDVDAAFTEVLNKGGAK
jgi:hypothetical protein